MKLLVLLAGMLVAFVGVASAIPLCTSIGVESPATVADYVALGSYNPQTGTGGCQVGDKIFSDFIYDSTSNILNGAVPAGNVNVTLDTSNAYNPGLIFSSIGWVVPAASSTPLSVDSSVSFIVTVLTGGHLIDDASLTLVSSTFSGSGSGSITETLASGLQLVVRTGGQNVSHVSFAPASSLSVTKDLLITVPGISPDRPSGSAQIFSFEENFSEIPEPAGSVLIGSGLLALGFWRHRASCA
jgi:hypothetical protein